ncbi:MAG: hypothetical protein R3Y09_13160 [Clostridia bacterium]
MQVSREQFENKQNAVIINDVEYVVPARTQSVQDNIDKINKDKHITEFDRYFKCTEAVLGLQNANQIFSNGKDENLDYMAQVVIAILEVYDNFRKKVQEKATEEVIAKLKPMIQPINEVTNNVRYMENVSK